jgi:hypothetical protein
MPNEPITRDDLRDAVTHESRQQLTPVVLKLDNLADDIRMLKWTVYGNEQAGEAGLVKSVKSMQGKLDKIIELSEARDNQWKGIRNALTVIGALSSLPLLQTLGKLTGLWP